MVPVARDATHAASTMNLARVSVRLFPVVSRWKPHADSQLAVNEQPASSNYLGNGYCPGNGQCFPPQWNQSNSIVPISLLQPVFLVFGVKRIERRHGHVGRARKRTTEVRIRARTVPAVLLVKSPTDCFIRHANWFLGDLRWVARFEPNRCEPNQSTYRQRLPKVCQQQFHGQDEN